MAFKIIVLCATLAYVNAGLIGAPAIASYAAAPALAYQSAPALAPISYTAPTLTSQSSNIYRSFGNLGQVSTYSKTIDTPFSSVSKSDVRVSNPGLRIAAAPAFAAAPAYASPISYGAPALASSISYGAPALASPISYGAPALASPVSYGAPALTSQSSNIYRSFGNLGQVSTYSKTIDTPFSSVSKSDVRVSNPGLRIAAAPAFAAAPAYASPISYGAPALASSISYGAPALASPISYGAPALASPVSYGAPALTSQSSNIYRSFGNLGQVSTYSKTIDTPFSSVSKSDVRVSNPGLRIAAAPAFAAAPAYVTGPAVAHAPLIGTAYSAAPAVSHLKYVSGYANYAF